MYLVLQYRTPWFHLNSHTYIGKTPQGLGYIFIMVRRMVEQSEREMASCQIRTKEMWTKQLTVSSHPWV